MHGSACSNLRNVCVRLPSRFAHQPCCSQVYQKLLDAGLQPISTTYTALISAFGKAGQLDKAMETFHTMIQQGCERSVITYSALISACEKAGKWELALDLFDQMQREGCTPNTVTYNSLITACQQGESTAAAQCGMLCCVPTGPVVTLPAV